MADSYGKYASRYEGDHHPRGKRINEEVRKRPLPDLSIDNDSLNLRIVYPKTLYVVGVGKELNDAATLKKYENLGQYGNILDVVVKDSNYSEPSNKFIIQFEKTIHAALAFKGINLLKTRSNHYMRAYFSKNKFCYHFVKKEPCRKPACQLIHENPQRAHYFMEGEINTAVFEDKMSIDIITTHLADIREQYLESRDSKFYHSHTSLFLPVHEVIRKLGLESHMLQTLKDASPYRVKSISPEKQESKTLAKDSYGSDHNYEAANQRSEGEDSEDDLKRIVFEFKDQYYVNEDQELQKEVEKFNKASTSPYDYYHSDYSDEHLLSASGIMRRNHKFLFDSHSSNGDRSRSYGAVEESLQEEETPKSLVHAGFRKYWFTDLFEDTSMKEGSDKFSSNALYDIFLNGLQPTQNRVERTSRSTASKHNIRKLPREDYYYKLDDEISKEMHEKQKVSKNVPHIGNFLEGEHKPHSPKSEIPPVQPLLMNFIDQKTLEMQENDKHSAFHFSFLSKTGTNMERSRDMQDSQKEESKPKVTPKKKKKKGNQIIIDDNEEEASLFRSKPKKGKAKKNEIRQQQLAKTMVVKEEVFHDDGVSEIQQMGQDESLDNDKDEIIEGLLQKNTENDEESPHPSDTTARGLVETPIGNGSASRSDQIASFPLSESALPEAGDGKDKKKKKKKAKKAAVIAKPGSQVKETANEELNQPDKEKDTAITEIDGMLRKNDNLLLLIFDVLDNNFMSEEFYVDKRRHFSKYVYVSDLNLKNSK